MTIGQLAAECQVSTDTVRHYERVGLLPRPQRAHNGYRLYGDSDRQRLDFVRRAQAVGLTLAEVKDLLRDQPGGTSGECQRVASLLRKRIAEVDGRIADLQTFRSQLAQNLAACEAAVTAACPAIVAPAGRPRRRNGKEDS